MKFQMCHHTGLQLKAHGCDDFVLSMQVIGTQNEWNEYIIRLLLLYYIIISLIAPTCMSNWTRVMAARAVLR